MLESTRINRLHRDTVERWHEQEIDNPFDGLLRLVCQQHRYNFLLWHQEDIARSRDVSDAEIARVKRAIDGYNQQRNDWIEKIDDALSEELASRNVKVDQEAPRNSETPGSIVDRLSILSLRIYHLEEQAQRRDVSTDHLESVQQKLAICLEQQDDLSSALDELILDMLAGRKRHKTYRQLKMYNDPTLNPYLYQAKQRLAG